MPAYVGLPRTHSVGLAPGYHGAAYLGVAYNPFVADGDPNSERYRVPNLALPSRRGFGPAPGPADLAGVVRSSPARRRCVRR